MHYYGVNTSNKLQHHGVLGMKWGVRRYQRKDGSLTSAGLHRYDKDRNKLNFLQKHNNKLIEKYKAKGYGENAAQIAAKRQMRVEAAIAGVAAVAVGVIATKGAIRFGQNYCDKTIKSGKVIQNIGAYKDADFQDTPFFAAINRHDKRAYGHLYPAEKRGMVMLGGKNPEIFNNQIKMTRDVKRASVKNAKKIFYEKMESDPQFKSNVIKTLKTTNYDDSAAINAYLQKGKKSTKLYERFNQSLATPQMQSSGLHKEYYNALKDKGYNAILDINDTRYSGYKKISKSPTIFFGNDGWKKVGSTKLSDVTIDANRNKYAYEYAAKQLGVKAGKLGAAGVVAKNVADQRIINAYLEKHPNTKLTDKEILKAVRE